MGRGNLTKDEIRILRQNPYVEEVNGSRITYSEEFKMLFVKEYFGGKKPTAIFRDAGFDVSVLGSKRIERCSARWREANAAGSLGKKYENNNFYKKNENSIQEMGRTISEQRAEIEQLRLKIKRLEGAMEQHII